MPVSVDNAVEDTCSASTELARNPESPDGFNRAAASLNQAFGLNLIYSAGVSSRTKWPRTEGHL
jgi:hypothetical protein